ncbi:MAG: glutamate ligase domain-containing protein, partial [Planctomycetaceae bacterium]
GARGGPRPPARYPLAMTGAHQAGNAAMAVTAVRVLGDLGYTIPRRAVARGLAVARLPARIECVGRRPLVVVDAAHNAASMQALVESLGAAIAAIRASGAPAVLLFAASNDKAVEEMLAAVRGRFDRVILTQAARSLRATPTARLAAIAASLGLPVAGAIPDARAAFDRARALAGRDGLVCVAGSFFLAGDVLDRQDGAAEGLDDPRAAAGRSAAPRAGQG